MLPRQRDEAGLRHIHQSRADTAPDAIERQRLQQHLAQRLRLDIGGLRHNVNARIAAIDRPDRKPQASALVIGRPRQHRRHTPLEAATQHCPPSSRSSDSTTSESASAAATISLPGSLAGSAN